MIFDPFVGRVALVLSVLAAVGTIALPIIFARRAQRKAASETKGGDGS